MSGITPFLQIAKGDLAKKEFLINPFESVWNKGALSLPPEKFKKEKARLKKMKGYDEQLRHIFSLQFESRLYIDFQLREYFGTHPQWGYPQWGEVLDFTPRSKEQIKMYNLLAQELIQKENGKRPLYFTCSRLIDDLISRIAKDESQRTYILNAELERIKRWFPQQHDLMHVIRFGDSPTSNNENGDRANELFYYFLENREIDFAAEFINPHHHIEILSTKEAYGYFKYINNQLKPGSKNNAVKPPLNSLSEIFFNKEDFKICVSALRSVTPPVISATNTYLLGPRKKGAIVAWIDVLKNRGKIKDVELKDLIALLNNFFEELDFGGEGRVFSDTQTSSYKYYRGKLLAIIS
jgi:hypothetical protein